MKGGEKSHDRRVVLPGGFNEEEVLLTTKDSLSGIERTKYYVNLGAARGEGE
jgi:hypothetical protein